MLTLRRTKVERARQYGSTLHSSPCSGSVDMSQNNPIRVFVTHAWDTSDEYLRIFEYLESARNFFYKNLSAPDRAPAAGGNEADREEPRKQIARREEQT